MKKLNLLLGGLCAFSIFTLASCKNEYFLIKYNYTLNTDKESYTLYFTEDYDKKTKSFKKDLLSEEGTLSNEITELNIPSYYNNLPVTSIVGFDKNELTMFGDDLQHMRYENYSKVKNVVLPEHLETFDGSFLVGFDLNTNEYNTEKYLKSESNDYFCLLKTEIKEGNIDIHPDCKIIGSSAFKKTYFDSINLPNNLQSISSNAFNDCMKLKNITLPNGLLYIGDYAFDKTPLESILIPSSVKRIGNAPFSIKTSITIDENNLYYDHIEDTIYEKDTKKLIQINNDAQIPNDCIIIGKDALDHKSIEELIIPNTVHVIEDNYIRANKVYLPDNLEEAGYVVFCSSDVYYSDTMNNFKKMFPHFFAKEYGSWEKVMIHCEDGDIDLEEERNKIEQE